MFIDKSLLCHAILSHDCRFGKHQIDHHTADTTLEWYSKTKQVLRRLVLLATEALDKMPPSKA